MGRKRINLPKTAGLFCRKQDCEERIKNSIRNLHNWLRKKKISLSNLAPQHIEEYLRQPGNRVIKESSRKRLYSNIKPYLIWLHCHEHINFMPQSRKSSPIPKPVAEFIDTLKPVKKKATWQGYTSNLRSFHSWLTANSLQLKNIRRRHMEQWLQHLMKQGLCQVYRNKVVINIRVYLRWLEERELITAYPEELLRISDIPKKPVYLPRPFPPEVDRELQKRLAIGDHIHHRALLLMRRTGLRMGELLQLTPHCLEKDHLDNAFLKVPLGKLDNERMVPLDADTHKILESLQRQCPKGSELLLEPNSHRLYVRRSLSQLLKDTTADLNTHGPAVSHRLRHTYATELLNAGMNLVAIMRLLGHHSIQMTLRYAALTQDTVAKEYHDALTKTESRYQLSSPSNPEPNPNRLLLDTISWLRKNYYSDPSSKRTSNGIIKRIHRIRQDISNIISQSNTL